MDEFINPGGEKEDPKPSYVARQWIIRLASGEMTAEELHQFKMWLAEDSSHQLAFEQERKFWHQLEGLEGAAVWEHTGPERKILPGSHRAFLRSPPRRLVIAGGLAAACLALILVYQDIKMLWLADHSTSVGGQQTVTLPDGSLAHLNTDTAIAVTYSTNERRIDLLRGEAFFEVVHKRWRPFRVMAQSGVSQAIGTAFVVHAQGLSTMVTVMEGTVAVSSAPGRPDQDAATVALQKGERTVYRPRERPGAVERVDAESAVAWVKGNIVISGLPFDQAMAEIDRYKPGRIILLADLARTKPVSGRFTLAGIDEAITAFAATQGLTVIRVTDYLLFIL